MSVAKAVELLRESVDLCGKAMSGETDPQTVEGLKFVREQLKIVIELLKQDRPAIPLHE